MSDERDPVDSPAVLEAARQVFGDRFDLAERYHDQLAGQGIEWGLLGPREADRIWERHILNSVALADLMPRDAAICDVGSGAGLPGVPLAIARPDLGVTLLEPLLRRYNFLNEVVDNLGITDHVAVERARAEDVEGDFDVVTSRAVGPLAKLLPWSWPLVARGGELVVLKGSSVHDELKAVDKFLSKHGLVAEVLSVRADPRVEATTAVRIKKGSA
ncbi:16S rRNA (guanine(527)-N(7))-methyltransferase RsmG [Mariniluteicoccus flavus]